MSVRVREQPLVAEYLLTFLAPSQATSDEEIKRAAEAIAAEIAAERLPNGQLPVPSLTEGFTARIDPLAVGEKCAWCRTPILAQVSSAARQNTDVMEAMERVERHRSELTSLLAEIAEKAHTLAADDFASWARKRLAAYRGRV